MPESFHWRSGSSMRALKRRSCSSWPTASQILISRVPPSIMKLLDHGAELEETAVLVVGAEAHDVLDAGAVVQAAVEDHDLAAGWKMLDIALHVHLRLLAIGRRRQGYDAEGARADPRGDRLDGAALAGGIAPFEHDDDALARVLQPCLQVAELGASSSPACSWP